MLTDLKWALETVVWPPATKLVWRQPVDLKRWLLLISISFAVMCWTLIAGSFLMSFFDPVTGKALWIGIGMSVIAGYFAYLLFAFGKLPKKS
ncbi:hypothetical protein [Jannaschia marina]|uniref:hypothetical protein n=1 Tax=Jannaschia marina TaxID=2741674 RepID=UPI0015C981E1|nr:hypothetical protein [Jannaschia marina]